MTSEVQQKHLRVSFNTTTSEDQQKHLESVSTQPLVKTNKNTYSQFQDNG